MREVLLRGALHVPRRGAGEPVVAQESAQPPSQRPAHGRTQVTAAELDAEVGYPGKLAGRGRRRRARASGCYPWKMRFAASDRAGGRGRLPGRGRRRFPLGVGARKSAGCGQRRAHVHGRGTLGLGPSHSI